MQFIAEATQNIPPKVCQYTRRYGLYAALRRRCAVATARTKGKWLDKSHSLAACSRRLEKGASGTRSLQTSEPLQPYYEEEAYSVSDNESRSTWDKAAGSGFAQVYELDPLVCPRRMSYASQRRPFSIQAFC